MQARILLLMAVLLVSMSFLQTANAHPCHDNEKMQHSMMQEMEASDWSMTRSNTIRAEHTSNLFRPPISFA